MKFSVRDSQNLIFYDEEIISAHLASVGSIDFFMRELAASNFVNSVISTKSACHWWNPAFSIMQFWDTDQIPLDVGAMIDENSRSCPMGVHVLFNEQIARKFIEENYPDRVLSAFDFCFHPAMKSDYFRLAFLFSCGGMYVDSDQVLTAFPTEANLSENSIYLSPMTRHRQPKPDGSLQWCSFQDLVKRRVPSDAVCVLQNDIIACNQMNDVVRVALVRATVMIERCKARAERRKDIGWLTGPASITFAVWYHLNRSCLGAISRAKICIFDKRACSTTRSLEYKNDSRSWLRL